MNDRPTRIECAKTVTQLRLALPERPAADHPEVLREARRGRLPDLVDASRMAEAAMRRIREAHGTFPGPCLPAADAGGGPAFDRARAVAEYTEGSCHVFAVAVSRALGCGLAALADEADAYAENVPAVVHVYARIGDVLIDARGRHDATDVRDQWLAEEDGDAGRRPAFLDLADEGELARFVGEGADRPLEAYSGEDVGRALDAASALGTISHDEAERGWSHEAEAVAGPAF